MMTTELSPNEVERAKQAGARGWLVKPVAPKNLLAIARKLALRREAQHGG
jgi:DNA-binding response OmpR family regulator